MSGRARRHIRRRADLPPVPYHRWVEPVTSFLVLLAASVVLPALYFGNAKWSHLAAAFVFALIATPLLELAKRRIASRKTRRRKRTA